MSDQQYILLCEIDLGSESPDDLQINVVLPTAIVNVAYAGALIASGGTTPYTYDDTPSGSFPPGLVIDDVTGLVTGTPSATGYYEFTAAVTDSATPTPATATKVVSILVVSGIAVVGTFAPGEVGIAYSSGLSASGGVAPYTWSVSSGAEPTGTTINATTGLVVGTPSVAGTFNLTVTATDSNGDTQDFPTSITIALAVDLSTSTFPDGIVGVPYSAAPTTIGGVAPFTYSISSGAIPAGCAFQSTTGFVTGQPTTVATYAFDVTVRDALGGTDTYSASVDVTAGGGTPPVAQIHAPGATFDNGALVITGTRMVQGVVPYGGTITEWDIVGDIAGSASIVVSHSTYANYNTMTTLFTATCTSSLKAQATGLSHVLAAGDVLRFNASGFANFKSCTITLKVS